jgi:hypothetical protein
MSNSVRSFVGVFEESAFLSTSFCNNPIIADVTREQTENRSGTDFNKSEGSSCRIERRGHGETVIIKYRVPTR